MTKSMKCSIVKDVSKQESIDASEACINQKYCRQGTHVVCMSHDGNIQIVCNFSGAQLHHHSVYNIVPPIPGKSYSIRCGCPRGYKETRSCLCGRKLKSLRKGLRFKNQKNTKNKFQETSKRSIHFYSNIKDVSLVKEESKTKNQPKRHFILKSFVLVLPLFERNLLRQGKVTTTPSVTVSEITNTPMTSGCTHEQKKEIIKSNGDDKILRRYVSVQRKTAKTQELRKGKSRSPSKGPPRGPPKGSPRRPPKGGGQYGQRTTRRPRPGSQCIRKLSGCLQRIKQWFRNIG